MSAKLGCTAVLLFLLATPAWAQDVVSGPAKGAKVPPLKVADLTGLHKDKEIDYAADRKAKPTVYVLIQADKFDRPVARFLKVLDTDVKKDHADAYVVAVWLTDDVEKTKEYLPRAQMSLKLTDTALTCFAGEKAGPKDWGVNADAHVTVVVVAGGQVTATFGYQSINETAVPGVRAAVKKAAK